MKNENESFFLIGESAIEAINSKIVVLNKAAQFMKDEGFENVSESLIAYGVEIGVIINGAYECDVVPKKILESMCILDD